jgi:membrane protease YdiL (CAAX protease family)
MTEEQHTPQVPAISQSIGTPQLTFIERHGISPVSFSILSLIFLFFLYQGVGGVITILSFGASPTPENIQGFRFVTGFGQILLLLIPTLLLARLVSFTPRQYLRIRIPNIRMFIFPLVGIFSLQQLLQIYMVFQEKMPLPVSVQKIVQQFKELFDAVYKALIVSNSLSELLFVLLIIALIPAIVEELLFRGLVLRGFEKGFGTTKGVVFTGIIFAAYHLNPFSFVPLAVIGIYLGFLVVRANSVWVSSAAHFYNNAIACIAVYFHLDYDAVVTGNTNELSVGVLIGTFVLCSLVFLVSTYYFIRITERAQQPGLVQSTDVGEMKLPAENAIE